MEHSGILGTKRFHCNMYAFNIHTFSKFTITGWLEPLLAEIKVNHTSVVFPSIEMISAMKFRAWCAKGPPLEGIFTIADLNFIWREIPQTEKDRRVGVAGGSQVNATAVPIRYTCKSTVSWWHDVGNIFSLCWGTRNVEYANRERVINAIR